MPTGGVTPSGGGGSGLPAHWTKTDADTLSASGGSFWTIPGTSNNDFDITATDTSRIKMLNGHSDLLDVVSRQGNEMVGVGEANVLVTVGDGTTSGALDVSVNSFGGQGTDPIVTAGSSGFKVFRGGQLRAQPAFDINTTPSLFVDNAGGNAPALLVASTQPTDAQVGTSQFALWLDDTVSATKLMVKAKDSGGTVRTAAIALT